MTIVALLISNQQTTTLSKLYLPLFLAILIVGLLPARAQRLKPAIQLSGVVVSADSTEGLAGIDVYVPGTNRSTISKKDGFFSLPVLAGDTVIFQALGFEKQIIIIPKTNAEEKYTTSIRFKQISKQLPEVQVMPWATLQDFKVAVKNLDLPDEPTVTPDLGPLPAQYRSIFDGPVMDAHDNGKLGLKNIIQQQQGRYLVPANFRIF